MCGNDEESVKGEEKKWKWSNLENSSPYGWCLFNVNSSTPTPTSKSTLHETTLLGLRINWMELKCANYWAHLYYGRFQTARISGIAFNHRLYLLCEFSSGNGEVFGCFLWLITTEHLTADYRFKQHILWAYLNLCVMKIWCGLGLQYYLSTVNLYGKVYKFL